MNKFSLNHQLVHYAHSRNLWRRLHIDIPLLSGLIILAAYGLIVLYSAGGQNSELMLQQGGHLLFAFIFMLLFAQISPARYQRWIPWIFGAGILLLIAVSLFGKVNNGARRWLELGIVRFQPSEIAKLAVPMMLAWYFDERHLPPNKRELLVGLLLLIIPVALTAKQPDLGTALLIGFSGCCVIFLAGISWRVLLALVLLAGVSLPAIWHKMHDYQQQRVLTFLNPERDPLGKGYHIIQSKIAIGSGGLFGKGWLNGTQSHLHFLPMHTTDFIFAVIGEELGLLGGLLLIAIYLFITARCLYISVQAQDTFSRLLAGSLSLTFFIAFFVNIGMVSGIVPVVGVPLPLISYGGTSMVTFIIGFGILMSIHTHRKLLST